jgi:hypothetical protein
MGWCPELDLAFGGTTGWIAGVLHFFEAPPILHRNKMDLFRKMTTSVGLTKVLRIHDILVWIWIRGSMPLTNGSGWGSGSFYFHH